MENVHVYTESLRVDLQVGPAIRNVTDDLAAAVARSQIVTGQLSAFIVGSTGSITTIEYEPGVVADLKNALKRWAPPDIDYAHELAWHDGNGHSHVQAALMGPSITLPVRNRQLRCGTWQQIVVVNHDNRSRSRTLEITLIGQRD
jgi:secondary thiamine-phosphate synthase enzyme